MSHDAKVLLGREVQIVYRHCVTADGPKFRVVATSDDEKGNIYCHVMGPNGGVGVHNIKSCKFLKVWDEETKQLVDATKR